MACGLIAALEDCLGFTCIYFVAPADESDKWCVLNMKFDANQPGVNMEKVFDFTFKWGMLFLLAAIASYAFWMPIVDALTGGA